MLEGKWALAVLAVLSLALLLWCPSGWRWTAAVSLALLGFTISFYRDPERQISADPRDIVAPADGRIVEIKRVTESHYVKGEATMVAIFLSVFDVHVQRMPIAGQIKFVKYAPGKFLDVRDPQSSALNESRYVGIEGADGYRVTVRQIAGLIARRIVGWADEGTQLAKGERFGMIRFGSRVELYLPPGADVVAEVGEYAKGGETILARRN